MPKVQSRRHHRIRQRYKRLGIWIFLVIFAASIVGGLTLISIGSRTTPGQ